MPPPGFESNGFWLRDPSGLLIEVKVAPRTSPAHKTCGTWASSAEGVAGAPLRQNAPMVRPRRLSHVLVFTHRYRQGDRILFAQSRAAALGPVGPGRLPARDPRQRSSRPCLRQIERTRSASLQLGHREHRRHRARRHEHGHQGPRAKAGASAAMCSDRTTSITFAITGAAMPSIPATSTRSRPHARWEAKFHEPEDSFFCRVPSSRPTLRSTAKPDGRLQDTLQAKTVLAN